MMHLRDASDPLFDPSYVQVSQMVSEERCLSRAILKEGKQREVKAEVCQITQELDRKSVTTGVWSDES